MKPPDWFDISRRLRRYLIGHQELIYGWKWTEQCGQWVMLIIKKWEVYE